MLRVRGNEMLEKEVSFTRQAILGIIIVNVSGVAIFALSLTFYYFLNNANISLLLSSLVVGPWIYKVYAYLHKNNFRIFANPISDQNKEDAQPFIKLKYIIEILIPFFLMLIIISINNKIIGFSIAITYVFLALSAKMLSSERRPDIN